ncbi:hypothetical protein PMAYCL1PPCAC_03924, partial [Pristionchus mayeri]
VLKMADSLAAQFAQLELPSLSWIDELPEELVWKIMDFTPESVFNMRLTCRELKSCSDSYAMLPSSVPSIDRLRVDVQTKWCPATSMGDPPCID